MNILFSILILFLGTIGFAQEVIFTNANGEAFMDETELRIAIQIDRNSPIQLQTTNARIDFSNYKVDSLVVLKISGWFVDDYYNEYTSRQFSKIDTIALFQTRVRGTATPRFFPEMNYNMDSAIRFDADWFQSFLDDSYNRSTFKLVVYHAYRLTKKDKKEIQRIKTRFCNEIEIDEQTIELVYSEEAYTTTRYNFFNQKTLISKSFIDQQNTPYMKQKANEYSCALVVEMIWNKE